MQRRRRKPDKAYKDLSFLNSPEARTLRIAAEYLEPSRRFQQERARAAEVGP